MSIKISVITVVYNNVSTIKDAIECVLSQSYKNIEYIIIDGKSSDGTCEIIKSYAKDIDVFISQKDDGIYDGLNKAIKLATGDVVSILHSDDLYANSDVLKLVAREFESDIDGVYGDLVYTKKSDTNNIIRYWKSQEFSQGLLKKGWMPPHPTLILKKEIYNKYGCFDLSYSIASDYDFMLRVLSNNIRLKYIPQVLYKMRLGGASNRSIKNIITKTKDDLRALRANNIGGIYSLVLKNVSKISQFIRANEKLNK